MSEEISYSEKLKTYSLEDLRDVAEKIDKERYSERYNSVLKEITYRKVNNNTVNKTQVSSKKNRLRPLSLTGLIVWLGSFFLPSIQMGGGDSSPGIVAAYLAFKFALIAPIFWPGVAVNLFVPILFLQRAKNVGGKWLRNTAYGLATALILTVLVLIWANDIHPLIGFHVWLTGATLMMIDGLLGDLMSGSKKEST